MSATPLSSVPAGVPNWRELYKAALFEGNRQELPLRIVEAERALILRARELFAMAGDNSEEGQAVDDAMYALRALRNCMELKTSEPEDAAAQGSVMQAQPFSPLPMGANKRRS